MKNMWNNIINLIKRFLSWFSPKKASAETMSKILKVKITQSKIEGGGTHISYPPEYDSRLIQQLNCGRDNDIPYCIGVVRTSNASGFLASDDIEEISYNDAVALGEQWRPQITKIVDYQRIVDILAKVSANQLLTQEEKDAIDPENEEVGLSRSQSFSELLTHLVNNI